MRVEFRKDCAAANLRASHKGLRIQDQGQPMFRGRTYENYVSQERFPALDGLRALCVMLVITVHMKDGNWTWLSGALGVTGFFVLSGYLITMLALREESDRGRLSLKGFYVRRTFRIVPPYAVVLGLYCILVFLVRTPFSDERRATFQRSLPYYATYLNEFAPRPLGPFYQSWSLGIEEKFYLVWPLLAFLVLRCRPALRGLVTVLLIFSFDLPSIFWHTPHVRHYAGIMIGCLLAQVLHSRSGFERLRFLGNRWVSLVLAACVLALQLSAAHWAGAEYIYPLGVALVIAATVHGAYLRFLMRNTLLRIGSRSYGIYLLHLICINVSWSFFHPLSRNPALHLLSYASVLFISTASAQVLYRLVEKPCTEFGRRWSKRIVGNKGSAPSPSSVPAAPASATPDLSPTGPSRTTTP